MSKDPAKLVEEINANLAAAKEAQSLADKEIKALVAANSNDAKAALEKAETAIGNYNAAVNRITDLEQKLADGVTRGAAKIETLGGILIRSEQFKAYREGNVTKMRIEANTITGQTGSPPANSNTLIQADRAAGIVPGAFRNLRVADLIPSIVVNSNSFEYTRELLFTNAAAETAEGAAKPESTLTFELKTTPIATIATFLKVSKQILDDSPALEAYINTRLRYAADYRKESQIVNGNGTGQNISGILHSGNYTAFSPIFHDTALDSLNRAQAQVATADYEANGYLMNPADWSAMERIKGADGHYVIGNPLGIIGRVLWGLPVVLSNAVPAGTFICANFDIAYTILNRMGTVVEMFEQDVDNVQKNLITVRAENRAGLASNRPASSVAGSLVDLTT